MKNQPYKKVMEVLNPLMLESEKENFELEVVFINEEPKSNLLKQIISNLPVPSSQELKGYFDVVFYCKIADTSFTIGHIFQLDIDHIRIMLNNRNSLIDFSKIETIQYFAEIISKYYETFHQWLACYNGDGDNYDEIVNFIIQRHGSFSGKRYGNL